MRTRLWLTALALLGLSGCIVPIFNLGALGGATALEETRVLGEDGPKLALLEIKGVIGGRRERFSIGPEPPTMVARLREALDLAGEDDEVVGVILRVNSPGGSVAASETIYHELMRWKEEYGKPLVAYLHGLATSGGYYAAMAADEIVAHPTTVTGSIGVIMSGINLSGLMERFGIKDQSLKSGPFKDAASPLRPMRKEERRQLQSVIDDLHGRFVEVVSAGRPRLELEKIKGLADGRVFSASQALEAGLVDSLGHLEDAVTVAEKRAGISQSQIVMYHSQFAYIDNIYSGLYRPPTQQINIDVLSLPEHTLSPGFYYLWPALVE